MRFWGGVGFQRLLRKDNRDYILIVFLSLNVQRRILESL